MAVNVQDLQAQDDAYAKQAADNQAAQKAKDSQPQQPPSLLEQFASNPGRMTVNTIDNALTMASTFTGLPDLNKVRDVAAGAVTGAANVADTAVKTAPLLNPATMFSGGESPIWEHAKSSVLDFRDAIAVTDPTLGDSLTQGVAQIIPSFLGYSRLLSGLHGFANTVAAGGLADASAMAPGDTRIADLLALGRHSEGKFGQVLNQIAAPGTMSGTLLDHYINFLGHNGPESEAESRFKNVIDGAVGNVAFSALLHSVGTGLKYGTQGLRYAIDNGVGSASDMMPSNQRGSIDWRNPGGEAPLRADDKIVARGVPQDMSLSPADRAAERERVAAQRDREDGTNREFVPEPIPANAAEREGAAANRDKADVSPLESDAALSMARTHVQSQIAAGREGSIHDISTSLAQHMDTSTEEGSFYKGLLDQISQKNLETKIVKPGSGLLPSQENASPSMLGKHNQLEDTVAIYKRGFKDNASFVHTFAHESVHAATVDAINSQPAVRNALSGLMNEALQSPEAAKLGKQDGYGFKNPKEFVAEIESNPTLQKAMKRAKAEDGRPIWDHYKEVIGGIFGLTGAAVTHPLWDQVLTGKKEKEKSGA